MNNYGILKNSLPAERNSGLRLSVTGESSSDIIKNGGIIVGTVASLPDLLNVNTVVAKLKSVQTSSMTVKINASQTITITAGKLFGSYTNATPFDADDIQIDDWSKFEFVKMFINELSTAEISNYENGSTFNYENEAELILPMGLKQHDPTNGYSKDVSGKGNHANFGASTAEPTKLSDRHGYLFDGTDDYMQTSNELSLPEATFGAMVKFNSANLNCAVSFGDTGDLYVLGTGVQASEGDTDKINFGMFSTSWKIAKTSYAPVLGKLYFIVGVVQGTTIELWVNGVLEDTDTIASDARSFLSNIGKRFDPSNPNFFDGEIDYVFQKSEALSPIQIEDLFIELKHEVNIK